jgi:hypothetical protein
MPGPYKLFLASAKPHYNGFVASDPPRRSFTRIAPAL